MCLQGALGLPRRGPRPGSKQLMVKVGESVVGGTGGRIGHVGHVGHEGVIDAAGRGVRTRGREVRLVGCEGSHGARWGRYRLTGMGQCRQTEDLSRSTARPSNLGWAFRVVPRRGWAGNRASFAFPENQGEKTGGRGLTQRRGSGAALCSGCG